MPRVPLDPEHRTENPFDYPRLNLDKGERARILLIEREPLLEYVHTLQAPHMENGRVEYTTRKNRDGSESQVVKTDFVGRHICLGRIEKIEERGLDPDQCPTCAASKETDAVQPPQRRFAMHVIRYKTQAGSFEVQEPFSVSLLAWAFADKVFNQLINFAVEWGDMKQHDLLLGPCEVKQFQKFDIAVAGKAAWLEDATRDEAGKLKLGPRGQIVKRTFDENQAKDLSVFIGRKLSTDKVREDLDRVLKRHIEAFGGPPADAAASSEEVAAGVDLDNLLGDEAALPVVETPRPAPEPEPETPPTAERPEKKRETGPDEEFDDLLAGLPE